MASESSAELSAVLSRIELRELELLSWGVHDGTFLREEIVDLIGGEVGEAKSEEVLSRLLELGLVFEAPTGGYRSRMAETIHLLATLRQSFSTRPWWQSPELVVDYRVLHRPRRRPDWTVRRDDYVALVGDQWTEATRGVLRSLCPDHVAPFQMRAGEAIRAALAEELDRGVVVSAGTGSGKTNAFYLPAIAWIAEQVASDRRHSVKALAIYPRNELLKDQIKTALDHSLRISRGNSEMSRPLRIGAWFGAVPKAALWVQRGWAGWKPRGSYDKPDGWECPYLDCPDCGHPLVWRAADVQSGNEWLHCEEPGCGFELESERVCLTRNSAVRTPPDIMFTTTESLNRQLAAPDTHSAFGIAPRSVRMILLDEVHTYEGTTGAQNAFLFRRLRHALSDRSVVWAGLSATLLRAQDFFAELVDLLPEGVTVVEPHADELVEASAEYMVALRHNPASVTGPLSATIQTAMAIGRCLDAPSEPGDDPFAPLRPNSHGFFGSRTFAFTDKLDVTNRLYWDLSDAEGWFDEGRPRTRRVPSTLAHLRSSTQPRLAAQYRDDKEQRLDAGQWWWMPEWLGHDLEKDRQLTIGRTSSQDQGVSDADVIVATATLEVGYDDDRVGAVLQHKAPHDAARFLQRKGRAGRNIDMRPWTIVVLSDWGRDRFAWQAYDQLFDPQLEAVRLPTANRYVRRMQAVYATLDWLGQRVRQARPDRNVWADLAGPADVLHDREQQQADRAERQQLVAQVIDEVIHGGSARSRLHNHLQDSLQLTSEAVDHLMWTPPRPLMLEVLPTAHRRLATHWAGERPASDDKRVRTRTPLAEFVAGNLFDELLTPEVAVELPNRRSSRTTSQEFLPILRVLREFMPGNVTRHFGVNSFDRRHWVPVPAPDAAGRRLVDVSRYGGEFVRSVERTGERVDVYRPVTLTLATPPDDLFDSSATSPVWEAEIEPIGSGTGLELPDDWRQLLASVQFHLHADGDGLRVCRFARSARGAIRSKTEQLPVKVEFIASDSDSAVAALGAEFEADGVGIQVRVPAPVASPTPIERSLRLAELIQTSPALPQLNWVAKSALNSALTMLLADNSGASGLLAKDDVALSGDLVDALFRLGFVDNPAAPTGALGTRDMDQELLDLAELARDSAVVQALRSAVREAAARERDSEWLQWHRRRFAAAVGGAWVDASSQLVPAFDPSEVALDVEPNPEDLGLVDVWITELNPGGNGLIESLFGQVSEGPAELLHLISTVVGPSELEILDLELRTLALRGDREISSSIDALRMSWTRGHAEAVGALQEVRQVISDRTGNELSRSATGFIGSRIAGPGAPEGLLQTIAELLERWRDLEEASGFALDSRSFGGVCGPDQSLDSRLTRPHPDSRSRARAIAGLTWPRSLDLSAGAQLPGAIFGQLPVPGTDALRSEIPEPWPSATCGDALDAVELLASRLPEVGALALRFPDSQSMRSAMLAAIASPIESGPLLVYPRVLRASATPEAYEVVFASSELGV